jgi:acetyl-CoA acetyltransferase
MAKRFSIHDWQAKINEQNFDQRLAQQMGMSGDEFEDQVASRDIGDTNPFMDDDDDRSPGEELADRTIEEFRKKYRGMSDQDMDDFSVKMVEHFLDNLSAQVRAKTILTTRGI